MRNFILTTISLILCITARITAGKTVTMQAGQNVQQAVDREGATTTFLFKAGTYHSVKVNPHDGQQFIGEDGTVWNGNGQSYAIGGAVGNVVIRNIEFTGYNAPAQHGVINSFPGGDGRSHGAHHWTIEDCEIYHNGGCGIAIGNNFIVRNNHVHHQAQIGLCYGGTGSLVEGNEISYCNYNAQYEWGWEAGGSKFKYANDLVLRNNYVHDNHGPGLWADFCEYNNTYEGNVLENNFAPGIDHEISHTATIRCNIAHGNSWGDRSTEWLYGSQIFLSTSDQVEVSHNVVRVTEGTTNGITMCLQNRGGGRYCRDNTVHHNDITHTVVGGHNGADADWDRYNFWTSGNNSFDNNAYHLVDPFAKYFRWGAPGSNNWSEWLTFEEFQGRGQEADGTMDDNMDPDVPDWWARECQDLFTYFASGYEGVIAKRGASRPAAARSRLNARLTSCGAVAVFVPEQVHTVQVLDARGRKIAQTKVTQRAALTVHPRDLSGSGVYLIRAYGPAGSFSTRLLVP
ncbi:MAG: hypothetical protein GF418_14865 [Chitinivibrionales bacterium]|nr:hypothetical protein [Chitinivibrionales bacterium]MBD3396902.1 hypothetical protein [Chitinivibrionales bacterium]